MSPELFGKVFEQRLRRELYVLDDLRELALKKLILCILSGIGGFSIAKIFNESLGYFVFPIVFFSLTIFWHSFVIADKWRNDFKKQIIPKILQIIDPNLQLEDTSKFEIKNIRKSELINSFFEDTDV
jgi:hypothetical protein